MSKALVITEKPSVARDIVAAFGGFREEEGYWEGDRMVVTFSVGHIVELLAYQLRLSERASASREFPG